jgi:hypothetical protein
MAAIADDLDISNAVKSCQSQIEEINRAGSERNPVTDGAVFGKLVANMQDFVIHIYQLTAWASVQKADPKDAAILWKQMVDLCDAALTLSKNFKEAYPRCGTPELYDLMLDYRGEAQERYYQNLQDSECPTTPVGLFPKMT